MIVVMAASGDEETVRSPRHVWCFCEADARRASADLAAQFPEDDVDVFSVDFPELAGAALLRAAWRKTAEDCTELALAMYLKSKQPVTLELQTLEPEILELSVARAAPPAPIPLRRAA